MLIGDHRRSLEGSERLSLWASLRGCSSATTADRSKGPCACRF